MTIRRRISRYLMALSLRIDSSDFDEFTDDILKLFTAALEPKSEPPSSPLRLVR